MYTPMNECVCLCVRVCVHACRGAHLCTNGRGRRTRENPQCCQMFKRRSHVIKGSTCEHVCTCMWGRASAAESKTEDRTRELCSTGQRTCARSHVALEFFGGTACSHMGVQTHPCVPAHSRSRDEQSGQQGIGVCLRICCRERSFVTRLCRDRVLLCMTLHERVVFI